MTRKDKEPTPLPSKTDRMLDALVRLSPELAYDAESREYFRGYLEHPQIFHRAEQFIKKLNLLKLKD